MTSTPPFSQYLQTETSVSTVMLRVILALIPGIAALVWFFGPGVLFNAAIASITAVAAETLVMRLRRRSVMACLGDLSGLVTALLLAVALPPVAPWWITVIGTGFAILMVKHLFGGIGQNPFNPAMAGYVLLLVSFPREMTTWLPPHLLAEHPLGVLDTLRAIFTGAPPGGLQWDAITMATPLDTVRTGLGLNQTIEEIRTNPLWGDFGGRGWEWVGNGFLLGGLWMIYKRVITWHIPFAVLAGLFGTGLVFFLLDPGSHPTPLFHVFSGGAMLGAFFIATDPVSACTTARGKLIYGACIGVLIFIIRSWGGYPDGVAFAVLLMNMAAPTIDHYTQPRVFGHRE